jgi:hypothetical protein
MAMDKPPVNGARALGDGGNGVVNLRVNTLDESGDSGSIGVFWMLTDLGVHLVNLLLTVQDGSLDTVQVSCIDADEPQG